MLFYLLRAALLWDGRCTSTVDKIIMMPILRNDDNANLVLLTLKGDSFPFLFAISR